MDRLFTFIILLCTIGYSYAQDSAPNAAQGDDAVPYSAKDDGEPIKYYNLNEVYVAASESLTSRSATSVITTSKKEIEHQIPVNVSAVLQQHSGFTMKDSYQSPITLRGMSGKRLLTLRNGLRRMSSYPAGYMAHLVNVYDLEGIEVEKGYASVLYGSGAIAGTINLIDKPLFSHLGFNGKLAYGTSSNARENTLLSCAGWSNNTYALKGGLRYRKAEDFHYADGRTAKNSAYQDQDYFFSTGVKLSDHQELSLAMDWHNGGPWGKALGFNGSDYMEISTRKELSHNYQAHYQHTARKTTYSLKGFYSNEERELQKNYYAAADHRRTYTETTHYANHYYGAKALGTFTPSAQYTLSTGAEGYAYHISTPSDATDYIEGLAFSNRVSKNARIYQGALFAEQSYHINAKLQLKGGLRYDYAVLYEGEVRDTTDSAELSKSKQALSGHLALDYRLGASRFKVNLARAFRMPSTTELYTDSYTANGIIYATPGLKAEYCNSIDLCYRYYSPWGSLELSPFVWLMDDMIAKVELRGMPGSNYEYVNIGRALLMGGELNFTIPFYRLIHDSDKLSIESGSAYLYGNDITDGQEREALDYIPPFNIKSALHYQCDLSKAIKLKWSLRSVYYSKQQRLAPNGYATPNYVSFSNHITLNFNTIKTQPTLNFTINNLTNKNYYSYQSFLPSPGRTFKLMLSLHL